jgi:hypothetical protein
MDVLAVNRTVMFREGSGPLQGTSLIFNFCSSVIMSSRRQAIKFKDSENSKDSKNVTQLPTHTASTATYHTEGKFSSGSAFRVTYAYMDQNYHTLQHLSPTSDAEIAVQSKVRYPIKCEFGKRT